MGEWRYSYTHS